MALTAAQKQALDDRHFHKEFKRSSGMTGGEFVDRSLMQTTSVPIAVAATGAAQAEEDMATVLANRGKRRVERIVIAFRTAPVSAGGTITVNVYKKNGAGAAVSLLSAAQSMEIVADTPTVLTLASGAALNLIDGDIVYATRASSAAIGTPSAGGILTLATSDSGP